MINYPKIYYKVFIFLLISVTFLFPATKEKSKEQSAIDRLFQMSLEELMEIRINTAGKTSQQVKEIPASVVIVTRNDIETYGYQSLTEILENVPGLFNIDDYSDYGANFGVRGFWSGVANANMIVLVDGVHQLNDLYFNYPLNKILVPAEAIDKIEIIRGPMSVIYGQGAFFGVINIITCDKTEKPLNMVSGSVGSEDSNRLYMRYSKVEENFSFFLNGSIYNWNGNDVPLSDLVTDPDKLLSLGISIDSRTGGKLGNHEKYFNFSGSYKDVSVHMSYSEGKKGFYFALPPADEGSFIKTGVTQLSLSYRKKLWEQVEMESKLSYFSYRDFYEYDQLLEDFYGTQLMETQSVEGEINFFFKPSPRLTATLGIYHRSVLDAMSQFDLPSFGNPFLENNQISLSDNDDIITRAVFTQVDYKLSERLALVAGFRLEQSPEYELERVHAIGYNPEIKSTAIFDRDQVEFIPRAAILYSISENHILKLLYGKAINRPSFAQNYQNSLLSSRPDLDSEQIQTVELNYIGSIACGLSINASIFSNTLDNLITRVVKFDDAQNYESYSANAGKLVTTGVELAIEAEPIEYFRFSLSGTYQQTKDKREGYEHIDVAYSPHFLGYLKASYLGAWYRIGVTCQYIGSMETFWDETILNQDGTLGGRIGQKVSGYFQTALNLRFDNLFKKGLFLNLRCANLFNAQIRYPTFTSNDWATAGTIGNGRTVMITLGYKY